MILTRNDKKLDACSRRERIRAFLRGVLRLVPISHPLAFHSRFIGWTRHRGFAYIVQIEPIEDGHLPCLD